jgi:ATPase family AAA domain-containing protein 3A/B
MRHTINSFLYRTGSPSPNVIVVLATNSPEQIDEAVHDRIDEIVGFKLPTFNERRIMLYHYLVQYCTPPATTSEKLKFAWKHPRSLIYGKKLIRMEGVDMEVIKKIAEETEGFSGREIQKMVVAWHDAAFTLPEPILNTDIMMKVLHKFHLQHKLKQTWTKEESMIFEKLMFLSEQDTGSAKQ